MALLTNIGRSALNVMVCVPFPFFIEHLYMNLNRETAQNLFNWLGDVRRCTQSWIHGESAEHFAYPDHDEAIAGLMNSAPMVKALSFMSFLYDSCNKLRAVRNIDNEEAAADAFDFTYGCSPHASEQPLPNHRCCHN